MTDLELTDERIKLAFYFALGRYPENARVIERCYQFKTLENLRSVIHSSFEYKSRIWKQNRHSVAQKTLPQIIALEEGENGSAKDALLIFQTCDNSKYVLFLQHTSRTVIEYVKNTSFQYEMFIGIKRGKYPHHAMFNRIYKLNEYIAAGATGWVLYMDADAYIYDLNFDVMQFLSDKKQYAFIYAKAIDDENTPAWNINDGVFFANLSHPVCKYVLREWKAFYDNLYNDSDYADAANWDDIINDQTSLHDILQVPIVERYLHSSHENLRLFNSREGTFIRQVLRTDHRSADNDTFQDRLARIANDVNNVLERGKSIR